MVQKFNHFCHIHLLNLLLLMYAAAALFPKLGVQIKDASFGQAHWKPLGDINFSAPLIMLSLLVFNAGLSVDYRSLKRVILIPRTLIFGLLSNVLVPLSYTFIFAMLGKVLWHDLDEVQNVLVGLTIIASMPIAGSSTAWVQNSNGNSALILGLVIISTVASPIISPIIFYSVQSITTGDYSGDLHALGKQVASLFLVVSVVIPSLIGIAIRSVISDRAWSKSSPFIRMFNLLNLLLLNYSNASVSLPIAYKNWDLDFLAMISISTTLLCVLSFTIGWMVPRLFNLSKQDRIAMSYGLGMSNNGTGLVLASATMINHPLIMLPIIFYNLAQQVVAGIFDKRIIRNSR